MGKLPGMHGEGYGTGRPDDADYSDIELRVLTFIHRAEQEKLMKSTPIDPARYVQTARSGHGKTEIYDLDGVSWHEAPLPPRKHECWPQTKGYMNYFTAVWRCPCGGILYPIPCSCPPPCPATRWDTVNERRGKKKSWLARVLRLSTTS